MQHAAQRNNYPRVVERHTAVEVEEEHEDEAPWKIDNRFSEFSRDLDLKVKDLA